MQNKLLNITFISHVASGTLALLLRVGSRELLVALDNCEGYFTKLMKYYLNFKANKNCILHGYLNKVVHSSHFNVHSNIEAGPTIDGSSNYSRRRCPPAARPDEDLNCKSTSGSPEVVFGSVWKISKGRCFEDIQWRSSWHAQITSALQS